MVELLSMYNGTNNGKLFLSARDATDRLGFSDWRAAGAAFEDLIAAGLITCTFKGVFSIKAGETSRATAWNLNWIGPNGERLTSESLPPIDTASMPGRTRKRMERRQTAMKRYHKEREAGKYSVVETTTLEARRVVETPKRVDPIVVETPTAQSENPENPPSDHLGETTTYILHHIPTANGDAVEPVDLILATVRDWWRVSDKSDRLKLAKKNGLAIGELLAFVDGTGGLPFPKAVAVRASVTTWSAAA